MSYDLESILTDVLAVMTDNLNTKITAINTEKNDSITIGQVSSSSYFLDLDSKSSNHDPVVLYGIADVQNEAIGPATSKIVTIGVSIIKNDNGINPNIVKQMLRYGRALEEIFQDKFKNKRAWGDFKVDVLPVLSFLRSDVSQRYKIVGINIITTLA